MWLGYLEQYPDYMTQGNSLENLKEHLLDLYKVCLLERSQTFVAHDVKRRELIQKIEQESAVLIRHGGKHDWYQNPQLNGDFDRREKARAGAGNHRTRRAGAHAADARYGTNVVGGVTPGKGGQNVLGVPVFDTPQDAVNSLGKIDVSVVFVPAAGVKDAAISAIEAGIKLTVLVPDRVPVWDAMEIAAAAKANGATFLGPNTLGALSPGKAVVGMIGGRAESARQWFKPGVPKGVGVISRSGGMASSTGYYLGQAGVRISTIVHIGGDAVIGIRTARRGADVRSRSAHRSDRHLWRNRFVTGRRTGAVDRGSENHKAGDRLHRRQSGARRHALQPRRRNHRRRPRHARRQSESTARSRRDRGRCIRRIAGCGREILEQIKGQSLMSEAEQKGGVA